MDLLPALGTHVPMTPDEALRMFGPDLPFDRIHAHHWRQDCEERGEVSAEEMAELSGGRMREAVTISMNRRLFDACYDRIISIGQIVPHEVAGMAGYTKNLCIGLGGPDVINKSHFLGALSGIEAIMGVMDNPVRRLLNLMLKRCPPAAPVDYILTVVGTGNGQPVVEYIVTGSDEATFHKAARLSQERNCFRIEQKVKRAVVYLEPGEYRSTWLGNKAVYRLRKAMADAGELSILAPGVRMFGEDKRVDALIRRHGYRGTPATLAAMEQDEELRANLSVAAHLIHGSSEGRFRIIYATTGDMTRDWVEKVGYEHRALGDALQQFDPEQLKPGWNKVDGGRIWYVNNPGLGLWTAT